ncbi:MAG: hypothetical protein M3Q23_06255 [Actinomycetota bacterium]|nr:hypothetical protein [Actinomycetota bacterium]
MSGESAVPSISIRARFERFPATVKGAFVLRGEDADPHQVSVVAARVVRLPGPAVRDLPLGEVTLDAPPHQDLFVPFEASIVDLDAGWYGFEVELEVDGVRQVHPGDRRFSVPWPRGTIRTGTLRVEEDMELGDGSARVDRVQCTTDATTVRLQVDPPQAVEVELRADGDVLPVIALVLDDATGEVTATAYPVLRRHRRLRIELQAIRGRAPMARGQLEIDLP